MTVVVTTNSESITSTKDDLSAYIMTSRNVDTVSAKHVVVGPFVRVTEVGYLYYVLKEVCRGITLTDTRLDERIPSVCL